METVNDNHLPILTIHYLDIIWIVEPLFFKKLDASAFQLGR